MISLEEAKRQISIGAKTFEQVRDESMEHVGGGTYIHIGFSITPGGRAAGWEYRYPTLNFKGKMYRDANMSIEHAIICGHFVLDYRTTTRF